MNDGKVDWEKRAREIIPGMGAKTVLMEGFFDELTKACLQLGREMADARAEEIAKQVELNAQPDYLYSASWAADIARATIKNKKPEPETREGKLEAALRAIRRGACVGDPMLKHKDYSLSREDRMILIADRALEGSP